MVVLPWTLPGYSHVQIRNEAIAAATISNLTDPVLVRDPSIEHGLATNYQKCFYGGFLPRAHFRDEKGAVARIFLQ
jgi:hypothetical protein